MAESRARCLVVVNAVMNFGFHKCAAFVDYLKVCWLLRKDSVSWS